MKMPAAVFLTGKIVAYRPADRVLQVPSHSLNTESFLFLVSAPQPTRPSLARIVYRHLGYGKLDTALLEKTPTLQLAAHRDATCDVKYETFAHSAPSLELHGAEADGEKIIFLGSFTSLRIDPTQRLKCYVLEDDDFKVNGGPTSHAP